MHRLIFFGFLCGLSACLGTSAFAQSQSQTKAMPQGEPTIFASIKPLQVLLQSVMGATGEAQLLVRANASPHHYTLKPSQFRRLQTASALFYVDDEFEMFLPKLFKSLPDHLQRWSVVDQAKLSLIKTPRRASEHDHDHGAVDMHVWMSPDNAQQIVRFMRDRLSDLYPHQRSIYQRNSAALIQRIAQLDHSLSTILQPVKDTPFMVYHNAYQYLIKHYGLNLVEVVTVRSHHPLSARRIASLRKKLQTLKVVCMFSEPQFSRKGLNLLTEDTAIKIATLDPLGGELASDTQDGYGVMMRNIAQSLKDCLLATP